jgi:hypothetical protein
MPGSKENDIESKQRKKIELEKERILKILLEQAELTKDEIASNTKLVKGSGPWPAVKKPMDELINEKLIEPCITKGCKERRLKREREVARQQEIERKEKITKEQKRRRKIERSDSNVKRKFTQPKKRGPKPKIWIINQDISAINKIFNTYPTLQDSLRGQEWVRDLIVKQLDIRVRGAEDIIELKILLEQSRHFFKLCVNYEDLYGLAIEWRHYVSPASEKSPRKIAKQIKNDMGFSVTRIIHYRNLFAFCYFMDEFDGKERDEGHKIVEWCTRERFHRMQENHRDVILSSIENVMIPTLNMFFDSEKPDVMKMVQTNVQRYTALSTEIEHERKATEKTKQSEKIKQFRDSQREIVIDILKTLKSSKIVKKYYIIPNI